jgi:hypothetical protein
MSLLTMNPQGGSLLDALPAVGIIVSRYADSILFGAGWRIVQTRLLEHKKTNVS